ncbi:MAG: hypothetical protein WC455_26215 [Dehalococcoidia bacterium]|jgi:hypothetical protein
MGEGVTQDEILAEIVAYLSQPDYYAEGWRLTADIAKAMGIKAGLAYKKLSDSGQYDKLLDRSRRAWWRKKLADS